MGKPKNATQILTAGHQILHMGVVPVEEVWADLEDERLMAVSKQLTPSKPIRLEITWHVEGRGSSECCRNASSKTSANPAEKPGRVGWGKN